jgi:hypothetical protein
MGHTTDTTKIPMIHASLADVPEGELIKLLLGDPTRPFPDLHGFPEDPVFKEGVDLAGVPGGFVGDVDVLICDPARPDLAVAIQAKRIKFDAWDIERGSPKKLQELEKAYEQANRDARVGFSLVYLYLFVVVDSREQNLGKNSYAGLSTELKELVYRAVSLSELDERVGLVQIELVQPMDYAPLSVGTSGAERRREAQPVIQTPELTEWVRQKMACSMRSDGETMPS